MNELQSLKELLAKPAAAREVRDAGRQRVQRTVQGHGPVIRRRRAPWVAGSLGLTAAAAAVTVAITTLGTSAPHEPNSPPSTRQVVLPADTVLLAAASSVRRQPTTGAYYRIATTLTSDRMQVPGKRYWIRQSMAKEVWIAPKGQSWVIFQELGWAPATGSDRAAWKADGSPASWRIKPQDDASPRLAKKCAVAKKLCKDEILTSKPGPRQVSRGTPGVRSLGEKAPAGVVGSLGNHEITMDQVRRLPADKDGLRAEIKRRLPGAGKMLDTITYEAGTGLILELPVSPAVMGAAYEMLAATPGVRSAGKVTDSLGRKGNAVTMGTDGSKTIKTRVIIDSATGLPLGTQTYQVKDGSILDSETVTKIGWTNEQPNVS
ncbi:CU044_5270 family protein [Spirillospora sp. NPDC048911]|uniref:CU044_5270 family protein n=1 Tax=Spirillospora sp. NPDC048911 TaxID=3364527 RepID=UPI00371466F6